MAPAHWQSKEQNDFWIKIRSNRNRDDQAQVWISAFALWDEQQCMMGACPATVGTIGNLWACAMSHIGSPPPIKQRACSSVSVCVSVCLLFDEWTDRYEQRACWHREETFGIKRMFFRVFWRVSERSATLCDAFKCSSQPKCLLIVLFVDSHPRQAFYRPNIVPVLELHLYRCLFGSNHSGQSLLTLQSLWSL